jgi:SAM-dependent methyltransferase
MLITRRNVNYFGFALGLVLSAGLVYYCTGDEVEKDVPYVPTPPEVVEKMLELAAPKKGEVLYDLGCGDGRIVVTAAKKYGVKGTGVDIDPQRIKESNENAKTAGVADEVKFVERNLFEMDFHDANVVTLYLLTTVNERLRPQLLKQLKPGSRVVSHAFDMGDWEPDQHVNVEPGGQDVYFWVVPANVEGTWTLSKPGDQKANGGPAKIKLEQKFQKVNGTGAHGKQAELKDVTLKGDDLTFTMDGVKYSAKVEGDAMKGTYGDDKEFSAKREKAKHPIEEKREKGRK